MSQDNQKNQRDALFPFKLRGYVRAFTSPIEEDSDFEEFVNYAKCFLCRQTKRLWKDPIWDEYTDEEILVEYFSYLFTLDKGLRAAFEQRAFSGTDVYGEDIYDWLDRKVRENQEEMAKKAESLPDKVSFTPDGVDIEE